MNKKNTDQPSAAMGGWPGCHTVRSTTIMVAPGALHLSPGKLRTSTGLLPVTQTFRQPVSTPRRRPLRFDLDNAEATRRCRRTQMLQPVVTTEGEKVKITRVFVTDQSSRHWWKAYNKPESMWKENRKPSAEASAIPGAQMRGTRGNQHLWENSAGGPDL